MRLRNPIPRESVPGQGARTWLTGRELAGLLLAASFTACFLSSASLTWQFLHHPPFPVLSKCPSSASETAPAPSGAGRLPQRSSSVAGGSLFLGASSRDTGAGSRPELPSAICKERTTQDGARSQQLPLSGAACKEGPLRLGGEPCKEQPPGRTGAKSQLCNPRPGALTGSRARCSHSLPCKVPSCLPSARPTTGATNSEHPGDPRAQGRGETSRALHRAPLTFPEKFRPNLPPQPGVQSPDTFSPLGSLQPGSWFRTRHVFVTWTLTHPRAQIPALCSYTGLRSPELS